MLLGYGLLLGRPRHAGGLAYFPIRFLRRPQIGCRSLRATGITEYSRNGGKLEVAQQMANHESARTTGLYDRRND